jgi:ferredoxin/flavodoxin
MIFYFSGTGNSRYAAEKIAKENGTAAISIADAEREGRFSYELADGEPLGFVTPVYAWNIPLIVADFIDKLELSGGGEPYTFALFTCGLNTGLSYQSLAEALKKKGLALGAAFDVVMPDNYVVMFNPPEEKKAQEMLSDAEEVLNHVSEAVSGRLESVEIRGKNPPAIFSRLFNRFFNEYCLDTAKFHVTKNCRGCGLCAELCPMSKISIVNGRPVWKRGNCAKCMACLHRCPKRAVQYGRSTRKRRRYVHPIYR